MCSAMAVSPVGEFIASIQVAAEAGTIISGHLDDYAVDTAIPDVAVQPATLQELQIVLTEAHESALAVIPFGGGAHMAAGNVAMVYDVALSTARMAEIVAYEPADLTVTAQAGVPLAALQSRLMAEHRQWLPLDPACGPTATVGGVLAANAYGPRRHAYGTARDWLIGMRVVHADGTSSKSGGRVVKNVTGYDMHKLHIGALGTLGVIADATFKLTPLPKVDVSVAIECHSAREAARIAADAHGAGLSLQAAELLSPPTSQTMVAGARWTLLARVAGGAAAVERSLQELRAMATVVGARINDVDGAGVWQAWSNAFHPQVLSLRIVVAPSVVADTIQVLDRQFIGAAAALSATISAGVIRAQLHPTREARAHALVVSAVEIAARHEGFVVVDAAPVSLKRQIDVFGPPRPDFAIMRRLKEEFDPKRTLSPGRFVGRL